MTEYPEELGKVLGRYDEHPRVRARFERLQRRLEFLLRCETDLSEHQIDLIQTILGFKP